MFIAGILMSIVMCVLLLTGFICEVMGIDARSVFENLETVDSNSDSENVKHNVDCPWR